MLRYRAAELRAKGLAFVKRQLTETDRNGKLAAPVAPLANWATRCGNKLTRPVMEAVAGVHREAALPKYHGKTFTARARARHAGGQPAGAGVRPQGGDLRHLLRQLQQPRDRRGRPQGAGPQRRRDRGRLSALLRHAAAGIRRHRPRRRGRPQDRRRAAAVDRQGLRRRLPRAVLQPDAEVRVAADRARGREHQGAEPGDLRCFRVHRRHPPQGGAGGRHEAAARAASPCTSPATPARRTWGRRRPRC